MAPQPKAIRVAVGPGVVRVAVDDPDPNLATVDLLAWLRLGADRVGYRLEVSPVTTEVRRLLALAGLEEAVLDGPAITADRPPDRPTGPGAAGGRTSGTSGPCPGRR